MNYKTIMAATVMASQMRDAASTEKQRIIQLLLANGQNDAVKIIMSNEK